MKFTKILHLHLSGQSLLYTLLLTMLVSGLLSAYLLSEYVLGQALSRHWNQIEANDALRSGLLATMQGAPILDEDQTDFQFKHWGILGLLSGQTIMAGDTQRLQALVGQVPDQVGQSSLWVAEEGLPLVLAGQSRLSGTLYLPQAGLRAASRPDQRFSGSYTPERNWKTVPSSALPINTHITQSVVNLLDSLCQVAPSAQLTYWQNQQEVQAWNAPTKHLQVRGDLILDQVRLAGRIQLLVSGSVYIHRGVQLEHIQLVARNIFFEQGFQGTLQAFASDTLVVGAAAQLYYPSVLAVFAEPERPGFLSIERACEIEGSILYLGENPSAQAGLFPQVQLSKNSQLWGSLHVAGSLSLGATVAGHVATKRFVLLTHAGVFRNHLLDACIHSDRRAPAFAGPLFYPEKGYALLLLLPDTLSSYHEAT